jgi:transposase
MAVEGRIERVVARGIRRGPYCKRSVQEKRLIVEQCLAPGVSVAATALAHGINANLVRKWIRKYRAGEYGKSDSGVTLLPVTVREAAPAAAATQSTPPLKGYIDIELVAGRVRVHGRVEVEALRAVLASLR